MPNPGPSLDIDLAAALIYSLKTYRHFAPSKIKKYIPIKAVIPEIVQSDTICSFNLIGSKLPGDKVM